MKEKIMVVGILVILLFTSFAIGFVSNNVKGSVNKSVKGYTSHSIIRINNDTDFANQATAEGWPGDGSQTNPYIISGYEIDAHGAGDAIYIGNTTVYFVIKNVIVSNAYSNGLELYNVSHGVVLYTEASNINGNGTKVIYSSECEVDNNTFSQNNKGIAIIHSTDIKSEFNICDNNSGDSIYIVNSYKSLLKNNKCNHNKWGIYLSDPYGDNGYNTIIGNNCSYNNGGILVTRGKYTTIKYNTLIKNVNVGLSIGCTYYPYDFSMDDKVEGNLIMNSDDGIDLLGTDSPYFQVFESTIINNIIKETNISVYVSSASNNYFAYNKIYGARKKGIYLTYFYSTSHNNGNTFYENTIKNSKYGIYFDKGSSNNVIKFNQISNNTGYGIYMGSTCSHNLIYRNSFYYNDGTGDTFKSAYIQAYDAGTNNSWNSTSGIGNYWHDWANNNNSNDKNNDGIVDWPYIIDGYAGARDYHPLRCPIEESVPSPPYNLNATCGNGYVNLTWNKPICNGSSSVIQYNIYRDDTIIGNVSSTHLWYNDTSITNGHSYTYYVTAVNYAGESNKSNEVNVSVPRGEGAGYPKNTPSYIENSWLWVTVVIVVVAVIVGILVKRIKASKNDAKKGRLQS